MAGGWRGRARRAWLRKICETLVGRDGAKESDLIKMLDLRGVEAVEIAGGLGNS